MKKCLFSVCIVVTLLVGCSAHWECPACGQQTSDTENCPLCGAKVCDYCASDEYFLEKYYNSGAMQEYLESHGYVVLDEWHNAFELYMYGFSTGYTKGTAGIFDDEVDEAVSQDYDRLQKEYGEYGW